MQTTWKFGLDDEKAAVLNALLVEGNLTSIEFMNAAFTLMTWAIGHARENHPIAAIDEAGKNYRELQMEVLDRFKPVESEPSPECPPPDHTE
jgi:hypothetical protein